MVEERRREDTKGRQLSSSQGQRPQEEQPCRHLDLGRQMSRPCENKHLFLSHQSALLCYGRLYKRIHPTMTVKFDKNRASLHSISKTILCFPVDLILQLIPQMPLGEELTRSGPHILSVTNLASSSLTALSVTVRVELTVIRSMSLTSEPLE